MFRFDLGSKALWAMAAGAVAAALLAACGGDDGDSASITAQLACDALSGKTLGGATVISAAAVAASGAVPTYCKVNARIQPALNFEMRIPQSWNGKLHYAGGGGFNGYTRPVNDGEIPILAALKAGYINIVSDSGHIGNHPAGAVFDASWAINDPHAENLYASGSVPTVMSSAVELVTAAYGRAPSRAYFEGCSNGGREAMMAAQRNPNLFDGIIARAPAMDFVGIFGAFQRNLQALALTLDSGGATSLTPVKLATLSNAVLAACDAADGVVDKLVSRPSACNFNPATLRCPGGANTGTTCLSDAELGVTTSWTSPIAFSGGYGSAGWPLTGNEVDPVDPAAPGYWPTWVTGPVQYLFADSGIKGLVARSTSTDPAYLYTYDFASHPAELDRVGRTFNATDPDLRPFKDSGAKLILWHGGTDPALSVKDTTAYYNRLITTVGGQATADSFVRYYVAPGVNHCAGGPGADQADLLAALDRWVTEGTAPAALTASKLAADGSTVLSRPLCVYPQYARYTGPAGDAAAARLAGNYTCTAP